jgi:hypothetical protein
MDIGKSDLREINETLALDAIDASNNKSFCRS